MFFSNQQKTVGNVEYFFINFRIFILGQTLYLLNFKYVLIPKKCIEFLNADWCQPGVSLLTLTQHGN